MKYPFNYTVPTYKRTLPLLLQYGAFETLWIFTILAQSDVRSALNFKITRLLRALFELETPDLYNLDELQDST
jgi:hypothetical protein